MANPDSKLPWPIGPGRLALALVLVAAGLFWPSLSFDFVNYDDPVFVTQNELVRGGLTWKGIQSAFTSLYIYWQPLTWISYMLDFELAGGSARAFKLTNLLLHLASSVLLFHALRLMTGALWRSAIVAALFAIHPLHVETVAWISERKGVLCGFFFHLCLCLYARHALRPRWTTGLAFTAAFAFSLMAKSLSIMLPCLLLLLDVWPLRRLAARGNSPANPKPENPGNFPALPLGKLLLEKLPCFLLAAGSAILTIQAQKRMGAVMGVEVYSLMDRAAIALTSYTAYLRKFFVPNDLAVFYPNPGQWPLIDVAIATLLMLGLSGWSLARWRHSPFLATGWFWFVALILPVSGLLQTGEQVMADRYTYLALTGLGVYVVWAGAEFLSALRAPMAVGAGIAACALAFCALSSKHQLATWRSTQALFSHAHEVTRNNYLADTVLGSILTEEGRHQEALAHFESALKVQPRYAETHYRMALALTAMKRYPDALARFQQALSVDPRNPDIFAGLAAAQRQSGDLASASATYRRALEGRPQSQPLRQALALLLHQQGNYTDALAEYRQLIKINPHHPEWRNNLAWVLATHESAEFRNGAEAVALAEGAVQQTSRKVAVLLGTLAAAYAEAGRFEDAVSTADEARRVAEASHQPEVARRNTELREHYRNRKPWREKQP